MITKIIRAKFNSVEGKAKKLYIQKFVQIYSTLKGEQAGGGSIREIIRYSMKLPLSRGRKLGLCREMNSPVLLFREHIVKFTSILT